MDTRDALSRLGTGSADDRLTFRLVLRILLRCLPLLRGVRRHLIGFGAIILGLFAVLLPLMIMAMDVFWTGVLQGEPRPAIQAHLLLLDPALVSSVDNLDTAARTLLRDRLLLITLVVVVLVALPASGGLTYYYIWINQRINQELRLSLHGRLQALSLRFHADSRVGDAIYRLQQDSAMVTELIEALFVTPLLHIGRHLIATAVIALFDPRVALVFLLAWPPSLWIGYRVSRRLRAGFRAARETNSALTSRIQEILLGIKVVKAYGVEPQMQESFEDHSRKAFDAAFRVRFLVSAFSVGCFVVISVGVLAATGGAAALTRDDADLFAATFLAVFGFSAWNLGLFSTFKSEVGWASTSLRIIYRMWAKVQDMAIGLDRVFQVLDLEPEIRDTPDAIDVPPLREGVRYRNVSFRYQPDRPVLEGVSLEAPIGSVTALVGPTGSGKSTLVSLLLRLFDPDAGAVEIDGRDLRGLRVASLRAHVAMALQENLLFGDTVRENIRYAVPDASDEAVREAARIACADEFIERLPLGYDTPLGERGAKLSTGQRQRLSIARALLKDAPILVLDEPTASLDADTELRLLRNLHAWGRGRVIFLITHRLGTIRRADQIAVLQDGRLMECGTHDALLARPEGSYRRLVESEELSPAPRAVAR